MKHSLEPAPPRADGTRSSEEPDPSLLYAAVEGAPNPVLITDSQGQIVYVNAAFTELTGWERDEVIGKNPRILKSGATPPERYGELWGVISSGSVWRGDFLNRKKSGELFWEHASISPIRSGGTISHYVAIVEDMTGARAAAERLLNAHESLQAIFESSPAAIIALDATGAVTLWNSASERLLGWRSEEMVGKPVSLAPAHLRAEEARLKARLLRGESYSDLETVLSRKDGTTVEVSLNAGPLPSSNGGSSGLICFITDISPRRRVEEQVRKLSQAVEQSTEAMMITDREGVIEYVNPRFVELTGYGSEDAVGRRPNMLKSGETSLEQYERLWYTIKAGREWMGELLNRRKDGRPYWVNASISPIRDAAGQITHFLGIEQDVTWRKEVEAEAAGQLRRMASLRAIDTAIAASSDLDVVLGVVLDQLLGELKVDAAAILLLDEQTRVLEHRAGRGFGSRSAETYSLRLGEGTPGRALLERAPVIVPDLADPDVAIARVALFEEEGFASHCALPLAAKGQPIGVLEVFHRTRMDFAGATLSFLQTVASEAAIAIDGVKSYQDLQRSSADLRLAYDATIEGWVRALDLRDNETEGHTQRVARLTVRAARHFGVAESQIEHARRGALLHDIGKITIPDGILLKPGKLNEDEWRVMRRHPIYAYEMLSPIPYLRPALPIPYRHHERFDGSGYPRGLRGDAIPLEVRIFTLVDVWDALRSDRPYRSGWSLDKLVSHMKSESGTHFDPALVEPFLEVVREAEIEPAFKRSSASAAPEWSGSALFEP